MPSTFRTTVLVLAIPCLLAAQERPRARDIGLGVGQVPTGPLNAITDVAGVKVGHSTVIRGDSIRTGITAILTSADNPFMNRVPAAIVIGNGFGKLVGSTQVMELGELETPILLTCTLCVWRAGETMASWLLAQPGMEGVRSINPVVGETNDGWALNAIRGIPVTREDVLAALEGARSGPVDEGSVGAGTGTVAFGWKGGIGTSSRRTKAGWTVGVLVQTNYGGSTELVMGGVEVGRALKRSGIKPNVGKGPQGSVMIVVATDAPLSDRNLRRLATRALLGIGVTGASASNGSGDYIIAFSTSEAVRRRMPSVAAGFPDTLRTMELGNEAMSPLFDATVDATVEAVYNSLLRATTVKGAYATVEALPLEELRAILARKDAGR